MNLLAAVFYVFVLTGIHTATAANVTPYALIKHSSEKITSILQGNKEMSATEIKPTLQKILDPVVDFESIAKAVMGKHFKVATSDQQLRFASILKESMISLYARVLVNFEITKLHVKEPSEDKPFKGSVTMEVTAENGAIYTITYTVRKSKKEDSAWKVRNVILDGINLGLTYRNQFYSSTNRYNGDLDKVIDSWEEEMNSANNISQVASIFNK